MDAKEAIEEIVLRILKLIIVGHTGQNNFKSFENCLDEMNCILFNIYDLNLWKHTIDYLINLQVLSFFSFLLFTADYGVQFLYVLFWGGAVLMTLYVVLYFGNEYVDQPRLVQVQAKDKNVWLETPTDSDYDRWV